MLNIKKVQVVKLRKIPNMCLFLRKKEEKKRKKKCVKGCEKKIKSKD